MAAGAFFFPWVTGLHPEGNQLEQHPLHSHQSISYCCLSSSSWAGDWVVLFSTLHLCPWSFLSPACVSIHLIYHAEMKTNFFFFPFFFFWIISGQISEQRSTQLGESGMVPFSSSLHLLSCYCQRYNAAYKLPEHFHLTLIEICLTDCFKTYWGQAA